MTIESGLLMTGRAGRRGFTFIELLVSMTIIGLLANIAIPATFEVRRRAEAASIIGDHGVIRTAVLDYYAGNGELPASGMLGVTPPDLVASLPSGFTFRSDQASYMWFKFPAPGVIAGQSGVGFVAVVCDDPRVAEVAGKIYKGDNLMVFGSLLLFILG